IPTNGGIQETILINEPNVYRLIIKSQLPSAEKFETWLFEEVIPSIRKKGYYGKIDRTQVPNFYIRYQDNFHKIDKNYFSV
ncbi:BRO family protein, partial [Streptomyces caeruleatus]